ncbi:Signal transduction histidine kinase [Streptomyces zhaozhouensis]|uniref:histidine kinase n=1 Tax=Streptomyces zhaozhouensis TaxID=1300267 RepID=A0A286E0H0_9ACTN|nr:histidine kinase [Streptomyces zhaozhouensis]SOD64407.1 Signal transduction histidine kinase [Streptomyces zhaozhouensis]
MSSETGALGARRALGRWAVDTALFCTAVLFGLVTLGIVQESGEQPELIAEWDPVLGLVACLALWWRRRLPLTVALIGVPTVALASSALPAGVVIIVNLAARAPWRRVLPLCALYAVTVIPSGVLISSTEGNVGFDLAFGCTYLLAAFALGYALRSRRLLVERLRADAARDRAEHARRLNEARHAERRSIAREMHDVLAHRVSLLSVHAGALAYRSRRAADGGGPALSDVEVAESAEVIRGNAHAAVGELREVLSLLRSEDDAEGEAGEPVSLLRRIEDIDTLVGEAEAAGQRVETHRDLDERALAGLRVQLHRTAYRLVQEGLTNARKHAPGAPVTVRMTGGPGGELTVEVRNPLRATPGAPAGNGIPGAGAGLTGLAERVRLDGGTLEHAAAHGMFTLCARLPWPGEVRT